jgi:hypothetical protein
MISKRLNDLSRFEVLSRLPLTRRSAYFSSAGPITKGNCLDVCQIEGGGRDHPGNEKPPDADCQATAIGSSFWSTKITWMTPPALRWRQGRGRHLNRAARGLSRRIVRRGAMHLRATPTSRRQWHTGVMSIFIVQLGTSRKRGEGLRLGTVRRPPRGVPKADFSRLDYYDLWFPNLFTQRRTGERSAGSTGRENLSRLQAEVPAPR